MGKGGMLFALGLGSAGEGPERYSLHMPFELPSGRQVSIGEDDEAIEVGELRIQVGGYHHCYYLRVLAFDTEAQARTFFNRLCGALMWLCLKDGIGVKFPSSLDNVHYFDPPAAPVTGSLIEPFASKGWKALDGTFDVNQALVVPEHKRLMRSEAGRPHVIQSQPPEQFCRPLVNALRLPTLERVIADEKLTLAIEVYASSFFEVSARARFLRMVTALELVAPAATVSDHVAAAIDDLRRTAEDLAKKTDEEYRDDLERLARRIGNLKERSINQRVELLVREVLSEDPTLGNEAETLKALKEAAIVRGKLVHDGVCDPPALDRCLPWATGFVPRLLGSLFRKVAGRA